MKPSVRLRQSPDNLPRRINPVPITKAKSSTPTTTTKEPTPSQMPVFPPPNVILHSEDMNSKVFMSIGRAFMSVVRWPPVQGSCSRAHRIYRTTKL